MLVLRLFFASLVAVAYANPVARNMIVHERRSSVPSGFMPHGPAAANKMLTLRIALTQTDMAGLEKALYDVSTPSSALYGQHLTKEAVEAFVKPSPETTAKVNEWLSSNGLTPTVASPAGDWISITLPVSKANTLLDASFTVFTHVGSGTQLVRTMSYSIPAAVKQHVQLIHPTTAFANPSVGLPIISAPIKPVSNLTTRAVPSSCATVITPACLQAIYGIPTTPATQSTNKLAVSGFIQQFANSADLRTFLRLLRTDLPSTTTFTLQTIDGGTNNQAASRAGVEANLDIQYTIGVATGVPTSFISVGARTNDGDLSGFLDIINFLNGMAAPPQVLTTSYGFDEQDLTIPLATNLCNAYAQLGARGVSILFASGDGGVSGSQSQQCTTFIPTFPSGCPFMTSVGATTSFAPEVAADFSSGGFSNIFTTPDYQADAVSSYLTTLNGTNAGLFNPTGRAFPDISAQGENVEIIVGGRAGLVAGTSCSSPIVASIISLLNDQLIAAGKPPLGFLNPFLYSAAGSAALNDITAGSNPGCGTNGFPATDGWDPVTGLGTPDFAKLQAAVGL